MYVIILRDTDGTADAVFYALISNRKVAFRSARAIAGSEKVGPTGWVEVQELDGDYGTQGWWSYSVKMTWSIPKPVEFNSTGNCPLDENGDYLK